MTDENFTAKAKQFRQLAKELGDHAKDRKSRIKVRFPWGVIRRLDDLSERWPYLDPPRRRTVACMIQLCDVNRWHLNVWDIGLTAGSLWEWHCTIPVIAVIECLEHEYGVQEGWISEETKFKKTINTLHSKGVYGPDLCDRLHELREFRNRIHLYLTEEVEMADGLPKRYNEAVIGLHDLENAISNHWNGNAKST